MANNVRGIHVSPGVYTAENELTYAVKSLGITTLGLAGETLRGPAFQPMHIEDWRQFADVFGGTSTEKFKGSQYPKYELPYIAKSYLSESKQLEVVRVLGLSGYKAGPAWAVTVKLKNKKNMVVAVLRSRAHYEKYHKFDAASGSCECPIDGYDMLVYEVGEIKRSGDTCNVVGYNNVVRLKPYNPLYAAGNDCDDYKINGGSAYTEEGLVSLVSATDYGKFTIYGLKGYQEKDVDFNEDSYSNDELKDYFFEYPVSLNPYDKDYILKVLGTDPNNGDAPLYVESLYDVALSQAITESGDTKAIGINSGLTFYNVYDPSDYCGLKPVNGLLKMQEDFLSRKNLGQRYLADRNTVETGQTKNDPTIYAHPYDYETNTPMVFGETGTTGYPANPIEDDKTGLVKVAIDNSLLGQVFTVRQYTDSKGKRHFFYAYYPEANVIEWSKKPGNENVDLVPIVDKLVDGKPTNKQYIVNTGGTARTEDSSTRLVMVKNEADGLYYKITEDKSDCVFITCDLNNYASAYRYASTPWIVSNLKGDYDHIELNKLFRFHTISDGNNSNYEIKISIENILPDTGAFDVVVRDINDTDEYVTILEKFSKCTLIPGDNNYIAFKIGSFDGIYESKSKFITVEVAEGDSVQNSAPAGFLGYPMVAYDGVQIQSGNTENVIAPFIKYNLNYNEETKDRKQYFGLSTRVGVDVDLFTYKGKAAYINIPEMLTQGFHLDSRLDPQNYNQHTPRITVDGVSGYKFDAVSVNNRTTMLTDIPVIGKEESMIGSIYEHVSLRKFTVYFYGGFDGWDVFRDQRSNTDDFKMSLYRGTYDNNSGEGRNFNRIENPEALGLNQNGITSDWYAYLAAYRQFANPEAIDINVLATPGIDYVNNTQLVNEVIDMVEEERADSIYVVTTPDKPSGAADFVDEMYTPQEVVENLEYTEIDSNYTCTYYPWVKYLDQENSQYIYLPATKDVVRNFAATDNTTYPWYAPAGVSIRGKVDCVRAHYITKLADEDTLYDGRINPVKTFATDGVKIWGQKNLQVRESQLNRIAVRRLLLRMRKLIAIACRSLIFEPNDAVTKNMFLTAVTPIMDNIRANRGISDYRIEVNDSVESRDRRELPATIYFKPYNALEYVLLTFTLTPEGVNFNDI